MDIQRINALLAIDPLLRSDQTNSVAKGGPDFAQVLGQALEQVERDQQAADEAAIRLAAGEIQDISEVMIASERANLTLGLALQVRNKVLEAYQDIMRMQL